MKNLGEKLKSIRLENNLSMEELANRLNAKYGLNINKSMISRWENNKAEPYNTYLGAYAKEFKIDLNYLLGINSQSYTYQDLDEDIVVLARNAKSLTKEQKLLIKKMIDEFNKNNNE